MKHCRHAINVKHEACNVCSPAGNVLRATCNSQHAPNKLPVQFSPQLFYHFVQFSFLFYPAPKQSWGILLVCMCLQQVPQSVPYMALYIVFTAHGESTNVAYFVIHRMLNLYYREYDSISTQFSIFPRIHARSVSNDLTI